MDGVGDFGVAKRDVDVIVAVAVQQSLGVRGEFGVEDSDLSVGEGLVVVGFGGDFDCLLGLRGQECGQQQDECEAGHCGDCSIAGDHWG